MISSQEVDRCPSAAFGHSSWKFPTHLTSGAKRLFFFSPSLGPELRQVIQLRRRPLQERLQKVIAARRIRVELRHQPTQVTRVLPPWSAPVHAHLHRTAAVPRVHPRRIVRVLPGMRVRPPRPHVHRREHVPGHCSVPGIHAPVRVVVAGVWGAARVAHVRVVVPGVVGRVGVKTFLLDLPAVDRVRDRDGPSVVAAVRLMGHGSVVAVVT
mmetsp:Transcript_5102/g.22986  ORF Transcript_5102/g.22986 Transcript_5102/m.22986 type:complete len:211 (-) Transcript_5102:1653-2285(-)